MNLLSRLLGSLVWLGLALGFALTLWLGIAGLGYPYQLDYGEGIVLWFARQLAHGQIIYKGLTGFPYASSNYPPIAMLLSAALMPIFGDGYVSGRLLNFTAALLVAALIYRIVQTETRNRRSAAIAALFFIGSPYIYHWIPLFRVDLIGLAFAVAGVYFVWKYERGRSTVNSQQSTVLGVSRATVYCSLFTVLFLLALYTKQTLFAAPAAAFCAIWLRDRKQAIAFALALGLLGGAIYLALDVATAGGFTFGIIESNATVFLPEQLIALVWNFATTFPGLLVLALWGWVTRLRAKQVGVLEWYAATSFAFLVLAGRTGAWENYFFEALAIACVFAGFQISDFRFQILNPQSAIRNLQSQRDFQSAIPFLLLVQLALMWHDPRIAANLIADELPANQQLAALLKQTPGIVISEDMGALATSGKLVAYYTFQYSALARSGKWDQSWELNGLRDGTFPLVILERGTREDVDHYRRFTREFVSALDRYYARVQTIGKFEVYTPAPPLRLQSADFGDQIALIGWNSQPETLQSGTLNLSIVWQAKRAMDRRYTTFVHLEKANGEKVAQADHEPRGGIYPTTRWAVNEMVRETYALSVPADLSPGEYALKVGWYDTDMGDRLPVPGSADDTVVLTTFAIK